jgi:hypothetical protein
LAQDVVCYVNSLCVFLNYIMFRQGSFFIFLCLSIPSLICPLTLLPISAPLMVSPSWWLWTDFLNHTGLFLCLVSPQLSRSLRHCSIRFFVNMAFQRTLTLTVATNSHHGYEGLSCRNWGSRSASLLGTGLIPTGRWRG